MTDEEKKAIEYLKRHIIPVYGSKGQIEYLLNDTILNLIEKQSKEIEELKDFIEPIKAYSGNMERDKIMILINEEYFPKLSISNFMIPKSKIEAKIEEIEKRRLQDGECELALYGFQREAKLEVLQSLLNEEE